jgi:hypothetical protein
MECKKMPLKSSLVWLFPTGVCFLLGLYEAFAPVPLLVDKFLPDDAFYYFTTAARFARTFVPTFDGVNITSGFHPLWLLICSIPYLIADIGSVGAMRALLFLQALMSATGLMFLLRSTLPRVSVLSVMVPTALFISLMAREFVNGLETPLVVFLTGLTIAFLLRRGSPSESIGSRRDRILFGVLLGLLFLSRTDQAFAALSSIGVVFFFWGDRTSLAKRIGSALEVALPVALLGGTYLVYNFMTTGHAMQVSGEAKAMYSEQILSSVANATGGTFPALLENSRWLLEMPKGPPLLFMYIGGIALGGYALIFFLKRKDVPPELSLIGTVFPFAVGSAISAIYYHTRFFGPFSSTSWYYPGHYLLLIPVGAGAISLFPKLLGRFSRVTNDRAFSYLEATVVSVFSLVVFYPLLRGSLLAPFIALTPLLLLSSVPLRIPTIAVAGILGAISLQPFLEMRTTRQIGPNGWNYALYEGAVWARENTPSDASIWSGSSGVLSYFSGRKVVNTDGLINSYAFLQEILRKQQLHGYVKQFDYTIDAWGVPSGLEEAHPEGCLLQLPSSVPEVSFLDGVTTRKLQVYKMRRTPQDPCVDRE